MRRTTALVLLAVATALGAALAVGGHQASSAPRQDVPVNGKVAVDNACFVRLPDLGRGLYGGFGGYNPATGVLTYAGGAEKRTSENTIAYLRSVRPQAGWHHRQLDQGPLLVGRLLPRDRQGLPRDGLGAVAGHGQLAIGAGQGRLRRHRCRPWATSRSCQIGATANTLRCALAAQRGHLGLGPGRAGGGQEAPAAPVRGLGRAARPAGLRPGHLRRREGPGDAG